MPARVISCRHSGVAQLRDRVGTVYGAGGKAIGLQNALPPWQTAHAARRCRRCPQVLLSATAKCWNTPQISSPGRVYRASSSWIVSSNPERTAKPMRPMPVSIFRCTLACTPRLDGGSGECLRVLGGKTGRGYVIFSQRCRIGRVGKAQNQNRFCDAAAAGCRPSPKLLTANAARTGLLQGVGDGRVAVAVSVSDRSSTDIAAYRAVDIFKIAAQCCQVDLGPAVAFPVQVYS